MQNVIQMLHFAQLLNLIKCVGCTVCDLTAQTEKSYLLYLQRHLQNSAAAAQNEENINSAQSIESQREGCSLSNDCRLTMSDRSTIDLCSFVICPPNTEPTNLLILFIPKGLI